MSNLPVKFIAAAGMVCSLGVSCLGDGKAYAAESQPTQGAAPAHIVVSPMFIDFEKNRLFVNPRRILDCDYGLVTSAVPAGQGGGASSIDLLGSSSHVAVARAEKARQTCKAAGHTLGF